MGEKSFRELLLAPFNNDPKVAMVSTIVKKSLGGVGDSYTLGLIGQLENRDEDLAGLQDLAMLAYLNPTNLKGCNITFAKEATAQDAIREYTKLLEGKFPS